MEKEKCMSMLEAIYQAFKAEGYNKEILDKELKRIVIETTGKTSLCSIYHHLSLLEIFGYIKRHPKYSKRWIIIERDNSASTDS